MKKDSTISVVIATYNGETYISQQINSILNQSLLPDEIIIVDDNSSDDTYQILLQTKEQNPLIHVYKNNENLGYIKNFERAVSLSQGDYIVFSDQDDLWYPEKLLILKRSIGTNLLIHSDAKLIDENNNIILNSYSSIKGKLEKTDFRILFFYNTITGCTMMISRELVKIAFPLPISIPHDWWLALVASCLGKIKYIPDTLTGYRQHQYNVIGADKRNRHSLINHLREIRYIVKRRNIRLRKAFFIRDVFMKNFNHDVPKAFIKFIDDLYILESLLENKQISIKGTIIYLRNFSVFRDFGNEYLYKTIIQYALSWYWC